MLHFAQDVKESDSFKALFPDRELIALPTLDATMGGMLVRLKIIQECYPAHRRQARAQFQQRRVLGVGASFDTTHWLTLDTDDVRHFAFVSKAVRMNRNDLWVETTILSGAEYQQQLERLRAQLAMFSDDQPLQ